MSPCFTSQLLVVAVARGEAIAVVDLDHFPVAGAITGEGYDARPPPKNLGAFRGDPQNRCPCAPP